MQRGETATHAKMFSPTITCVSSVQSIALIFGGLEFDGGFIQVDFSVLSTQTGPRRVRLPHGLEVQ